jgi:signal recognition particle subunit SEC65
MRTIKNKVKNTNMSKTTAEIKYRGYVPSDWIAVKFCDIYFWGENASKYKEDCRKIECESYNIYNPKCEELEKKIEELRLKIENEEKNRRWYNKLFSIFYTTEDEKKLNTLVEMLEEMRKRRWKDATTLHVEYTNYLELQGFCKIQHSHGGGELGYDIEIYEKE